MKGRYNCPSARYLDREKANQFNKSNGVKDKSVFKCILEFNALHTYFAHSFFYCSSGILTHLDLPLEVPI